MIHFGKNVEKLKPLFIVGSIFKFFKAEIENKHMYKWMKVRMTVNFSSDIMQALRNKILKGDRLIIDRQIDRWQIDR